MTIEAKHPTSPAHHILKFVEVGKSVNRMSLQSELMWLKYVLKAMLYISLLVAIISFGLSINGTAAISLVSTALLAVLSSITIFVTMMQLETNKNWTEICVMTLCSVYAPFFVLWIASGNLLTVIVSKM